LNFNESSTAGSAIIANSNGLQFSNVSTAGSALINNGSNVYFIQASTGGTARLPADVQDKVFYWFETHSLGSPHRGTGLGLSLVRSFVQLHGGSVTLESVVGRGTTVTCVFPLAHTAERTAA
jgi:K+-sensing histidine kinase KdpD